MLERFSEIKEAERRTVAESPLVKQVRSMEKSGSIEKYRSALKNGKSLTVGNQTEKKIFDKEKKSESSRIHLDDNGNLYRRGIELKANAEYELRGYKYKTDEKSRIISAEGTLRMKERSGRLPIRASIQDIGRGDERIGDDKGHLVGDQFDGSNEIGNLIAQDAKINRVDFKNLENELAKQVRAGREVVFKVELRYRGEVNRPELIIVNYSIDGERNKRIFPN